MITCLSREQFQLFLETIAAPIEQHLNMIIVHATEGPVQWVFDGALFCMVN